MTIMVLCIQIDLNYTDCRALSQAYLYFIRELKRQRGAVPKVISGDR